MAVHVFKNDINGVTLFNNKIKNPDKQLQVHLYPEPYAGNAFVMVYLLNGNPGFSGPEDCHLMYSNGSNWDTMMRQSYDPIPSSSHQPTMYWLDPYWKQQIKSLPNGYDGGFTWWLQRTKLLRYYFPDIQDRLFNIDYHPYHSKNVYINKTIDNLPSCQAVNQLIYDAFQDPDRIFVIARCKEAWYNRLSTILKISISALKATNRFIELSNPRYVYLTPGNIGPSKGDLDSGNSPWMDCPYYKGSQISDKHPYINCPWNHCPWNNCPYYKDGQTSDGCPCITCPWDNCPWKNLLQKLQSNPRPFKTTFGGLK